jgi:O-antigen/teichoic acid export membrane protein
MPCVATEFACLRRGIGSDLGRRRATRRGQGTLGGMLLRDGFTYVLAKLLPSGLGFATTVGLTWILSPDAYGVYGLGLAVVGLGSNVLFDWHALSFMRWYQSRGHEPRFMTTMLSIFAVTCALSAATIGVASLAGLLHGLEAEAWILTLGTWAYAWFEFTARIQVANFRPARYLLMNLIRNMLVLVSGLLIAYVSGAPQLVLAGAFISMLVAGSIYIRDGSIHLGRGFDWSLARMMIAYGAPIGITTICSGLTTSANRLLLAALADMRSVAFLTAAAALVQASIGMIGAGIGSATYSMAVRAVESGDAAEATSQLSDNFAYLASILLPAAVGLSLIAPQLAPALLRPDYQAAVVETTPWLAASAVLFGIRAHYVDHAFQLGNRTWLLAQVMVASALVNLALNCLLIPAWGYLGAAVAMTVAAGSALVHAVLLSRRAFRLPFPTAEVIRIGVATLLMVIAVEAMPARPGIVGVVSRVGAGVLTYCVAAVAFDLLGLGNALLGRCARGRWFARSGLLKPWRHQARHDALGGREGADAHPVRHTASVKW